jgi:hypothetical protein
VIPLDYSSDKTSGGPRRYANEISPQEQSDLRDQFAPALRAYRSAVRTVHTVSGIGGFLFLLTLVMRQPFLAIIPITISFTLLFSLRIPRLSCPNCFRRIEKATGPFCPQCASPSLQTGGFITPPRCQACGRSMRSPVNFMLPDEETLAGHTFRLIPERPLTTRYVRYLISNDRHFCATELEVLDKIDHKPFDLRIALPDEKP